MSAAKVSMHWKYSRNFLVNAYYCLTSENASITERSLDTVACLGSSDPDGLRADCRDSDNLVADDRDDLAGVAAK